MRDTSGHVCELGFFHLVNPRNPYSPFPTNKLFTPDDNAYFVYTYTGTRTILFVRTILFILLRTCVCGCIRRSQYNIYVLPAVAHSVASAQY